MMTLSESASESEKEDSTMWRVHSKDRGSSSTITRSRNISVLSVGEAQLSSVSASGGVWRAGDEEGVLTAEALHGGLRYCSYTECGGVEECCIDVADSSELAAGYRCNVGLHVLQRDCVVGVFLLADHDSLLRLIANPHIQALEQFYDEAAFFANQKPKIFPNFRKVQHQVPADGELPRCVIVGIQYESFSKQPEERTVDLVQNWCTQMGYRYVCAHMPPPVRSRVSSNVKPGVSDASDDPCDVIVRAVVECVGEPIAPYSVQRGTEVEAVRAA